MHLGRARFRHAIRDVKTASLLFLFRCVSLIALLAPLSATSEWAGASTVPPRSSACDSAQIYGNLAREIETICRTQRPDGSYDMRGPQTFYERYPLLASFTLDIHRFDNDPAFLSQSVSSIVRYYGYLFNRKDQNQNLLVETTVPSQDGPDRVEIEDVGYNALLALDMIALARLYLDLRKPLQALYWYEGARTLQDRLVESCFDADANYFYSYDPTTASVIRDYDALSSLPVLFRDNVGDNHASGMIKHYLMRNARSSSCDLGLAEGSIPAPLDDPSCLLRIVLATKILDANGFGRDADRLARAATNAIESARTPGTEAPAEFGAYPAYRQYLACLLETGGYRDLYDPFEAIDVFEALIQGKRTIEDNEIVRLKSDLDTIEQLLLTKRSPARAPAVDSARASACIRGVYQLVSKTREQLSSRSFFSRDDLSQMSGLEPGPAMSRLLEDVVSTVRTAENALFELNNKDTGLTVSAVLMNERVLLGRPIAVKWTLATRTGAVEIVSAEVVSNRPTDALIEPGDSVVVEPGEPVTFTSQFQTGAEGPNKLVRLQLSLVLKDKRERQMTYHVLRSVYFDQPVRVVAHFPEGQILDGVSVPVDIRIVNKTGGHVDLQAGWYSPAGLGLVEGNALQYDMAADEDSVMLRVNVIVPNPCRPGSFPFRFKFFGNGKDLGTISSSLFRPYQWLFIGPFEASRQPLTKKYPPEQSIDLHQTYAGIGRSAAWQVLPENPYAGPGEVVLRDEMTPAGVGYLYTVIECTDQKPCPVAFTSNVPAAVFINGEPVLVRESPVTPLLLQTRVQLNRGLNNVLVKVVGDRASRVYFKIGDDENLSSDEFNNNLWELIGGFSDFHARSQQRVGGDADVQKLVTLRYADTAANSVSVIGTFNGWSPEHTPMRRTPDGSWEISLSLRPGKYAYRFLINNRKQVLDPNCADEEPDGYGGKNSVIFVMK